MTFLRCSCGTRVDATTRTEAWILLDAHVEQAHGRTFPVRSVGLVSWDSRVRTSTKFRAKGWKEELGE